MKTMTTILNVILLASISAFATDDRYTAQMTKNIAAIYEAETIEALQASVNSFERIANAEKTKWEPYYYVAYGFVMMANKEKEASKKDTYLDQALAALKKATELTPENSEVVALEGFVHMLRVTVDPAVRGQQYSMLAMQTFSKAVKLDEQNPRALALLAQMQFGTAQFFNQQPTQACATGEKALALFQATANNAANTLAPTWGKGMAEGLVQRCNAVQK